MQQAFWARCKPSICCKDYARSLNDSNENQTAGKPKAAGRIQRSPSVVRHGHRGPTAARRSGRTSGNGRRTGWRIACSRGRKGWWPRNDRHRHTPPSWDTSTPALCCGCNRRPGRCSHHWRPLPRCPIHGWTARHYIPAKRRGESARSPRPNRRSRTSARANALAATSPTRAQNRPSAWLRPSGSPRCLGEGAHPSPAMSYASPQPWHRLTPEPGSGRHE